MDEIKAILYDLDGVLVNACEWNYDSLNRALKEVEGIVISREDHLNTFNGLPSNKKLDILKDKGFISNNSISEIWKLKQKYTIDVIKDHAFKDFYKIKLHKWSIDQGGIRSACVTNSISETANLMLDSTGQLEYMDFVISNEDVKIPKPDPMPYLLAIDMLKLSPKNVLIIEDSDKGYQSAIASKAKVVRVNDCYDVTQKLIEENL